MILQFKLKTQMKPNFALFLKKPIKVQFLQFLIHRKANFKINLRIYYMKIKPRKLDLSIVLEIVLKNNNDYNKIYKICIFN